MATSSNDQIPETENLFSIFYCVSEIYVKYGVFSKKKDQSHSLSIKVIINCETDSYLYVQKAMFDRTLRKKTC